MAGATVLPVIDQVLFNPSAYRQGLLQACAERGVALEAYSPLGTGRALRHPASSDLQRRASYPGDVKHADLHEENCAIARSSGIVGERWIWVLLRQAFNGARRFEDYQRGVGLARNVLVDKLNSLVEHDVLERRRYSEHTSRELYEYRLTEKGRELFPIYAALMEWGNRWTGLPAPPVELFHKPCGERVTARVVCSNCGEDLDAHDTEPVVGPGLIAHRANRP